MSVGRRIAIGLAVFAVLAVGWVMFGGLSTIVALTTGQSGGIGSISVGTSEGAVELALTLIAVVIVLVVLHVDRWMRSRERDES